MSLQEWLLWLLLGSLLGVVGQLIRTIVGIKKLYDQRPPDAVTPLPGFSWNKLVLSVLIGAVAGVLGALTLQTTASFDPQKLGLEVIAPLIAVGYAGADFIEGFAQRHLPK